MKSVLRSNAGTSSPISTSSKYFTVIASVLVLVADQRRHAVLDHLAVLVRPLEVAVGVEHQAVAALALLPVRQPHARGDHVTRAHAHAERVDHATVEDVA